ncbi:hypothetical protein [Nonomuraea sp. NPDC049400]|uniref:hypothetical protein n=1 Tax=Nonomuraea sp. NPDC049400 TaxID=3364352 RepID=UPI0037B9B8BF
MYFTTPNAMARGQKAVTDAANLDDSEFLSKRETSLVFHLGALSTVVLADELNIDVREFDYSQAAKLLSAQELNALVLFIRDLVAARMAGAA